MKPVLRKHKAVSTYLRLTGGRLSANFTHQYLPLFYSSNSPDIVIQNVIMALLGNLLQYIGSLSLLKTISISIPAAKLVLALPRMKSGKQASKISVPLKQFFSQAHSRTDQYLMQRKEHTPPAVSA